MSSYSSVSSSAGRSGAFTLIAKGSAVASMALVTWLSTIPSETKSYFPVHERGLVIQASAVSVSPRSLHWNVGNFGKTNLLSSSIQTELLSSFIDQESVDVAGAAATQAAAVVLREGLEGKPRIMFSSDGILVLQWQKEAFGAALIFAGDGTVSVTYRSPGRLYSDNDLELSVTDALPAEFLAAIVRLA